MYRGMYTYIYIYTSGIQGNIGFRGRSSDSGVAFSSWCLCEAQLEADYNAAVAKQAMRKDDLLVLSRE